MICGGQNLSLGVRLGFHSLITLRPRRRKHGKGPVTNNRADEHPGMLVREGHPPQDALATKIDFKCTRKG